MSFNESPRAKARSFLNEQIVDPGWVLRDDRKNKLHDNKKTIFCWVRGKKIPPEWRVFDCTNFPLGVVLIAALGNKIKNDENQKPEPGADNAGFFGKMSDSGDEDQADGDDGKKVQ